MQKPLIPLTLYIVDHGFGNYVDVFGVQKQLASESAAKNLYHPMKDLHNQVGNTSRGWVLRVPLRSGNFFQGFKSKEGIHWLFTLAKTNSSPIKNLIFFGLLPSKCWKKSMSTFWVHSGVVWIFFGKQNYESPKSTNHWKLWKISTSGLYNLRRLVTPHGSGLVREVSPKNGDATFRLRIFFS